MNAARTVFVAELVERFAYYGSVFVVPSFMTVVFGTSQQLANVVLNIIFTVSPLTSLFACVPADSFVVGKARVVIIGAVLYCIGLILFTVSSLPILYDEFPGSPKQGAWIALFGGIFGLSLGYGFYKAVTAPLVADAFDAAGIPESSRSRYFAFYAWIINLGGLAGTMVSPFLRRMSSDRTPDPDDGSSEVTVAYYYSFGFCSLVSIFGLILLTIQFNTLRRVEPAPVEGDQSLVETARAFLRESALSERRQFFRACATFIPLPPFWMVQNQFLSNVMFQVQWTDVPNTLPQEFFNNIGTIVMLVTVVMLQALFKSRGRIPSQRSRMMLGFGIVCGSMVYCALAQMAIDERGYFDSADDYSVRPGRVELSAWVFVPVYAASGVSSALIDPTTLEAAFSLAPSRYKSLVMCVYLVAASCSGLLGLAFAPLASPGTMTLMYAIMTVLMAIVAFAWRRIRIAGLDSDIFLTDTVAFVAE